MTAKALASLASCVRRTSWSVSLIPARTPPPARRESTSTPVSAGQVSSIYTCTPVHSNTSTTVSAGQVSLIYTCTPVHSNTATLVPADQVSASGLYTPVETVYSNSSTARHVRFISTCTPIHTCTPKCQYTNASLSHCLLFTNAHLYIQTYIQTYCKYENA